MAPSGALVVMPWHGFIRHLKQILMPRGAFNALVLHSRGEFQYVVSTARYFREPGLDCWSVGFWFQSVPAGWDRVLWCSALSEFQCEPSLGI